MSIVNVNAEMMVSSVVEAMLPRFSDEKLGLLLTFDMGMSDYGFGLDGNTYEREELLVRQYPSFLFVRPSNYTQTYFYMPPAGSKGLDLFPGSCRKEIEWTLVCDHDSCWSDAVGSELSKVYFAMVDKFNGRKIGGRELRPCDLSVNVFPSLGSPRYMRLMKFEQVNPAAQRYSPEARQHRILLNEVGFQDIMPDDRGRMKFKV